MWQVARVRSCAHFLHVSQPTDSEIASLAAKSNFTDECMRWFRKKPKLTETGAGDNPIDAATRVRQCHRRTWRKVPQIYRDTMENIDIDGGHIRRPLV